MASQELIVPQDCYTMVLTDMDSPDPAVASLIQRVSSITPIRPRASSQGPISSRYSETSAESGAVSPVTGIESPPRGRTMDILGAHHGLVSRATARRRAGPSSIDLDSSLIRARLNHPITRARSITPQDTIIESLPPSTELVVPNFHEVLTRASTTLSVSSIDLTRFRGHRDTFALLDLRGLPRRAPELPTSVVHRLASFLDADTLVSFRLTCRSWLAALDAVRPLTLPYSAAQRLPTELLQQIYADLEPMEFNVARKTCRQWMMAGLDTKLLGEMLTKGGWWGAVLADRDVWWDNGLGLDSITDEWMMSKRLATECSLSARWKGTGFEERDAQSNEKSIESKSYATGRSSLTLTCQTDFSELAGGFGVGDQQGPALHFTSSACGRFLMVAEGCVIFVYQLKEIESWPSRKTTYGGYLKHYTTVVCPKRVLAASMDTSSHRYAVAALLDDRTGMVCGINPSFADQRDQTHQGDRLILSKKGKEPCDISEHFAQDNITSPDVSPTPTMQVFNLSNQSTQPHARSIYRSLGSPSDPPLSVAICPQRRCVAFGCSTGIELHWVDALTGQDLNRWFPLTAPSDFLFFIPARRGIDSTKKLRLVGSAACEGQEGTLNARFRRKSVFESWRTHWQLTRWREDPHVDNHATEGPPIEYYKAIPLSDGERVLYTDTVSKTLCLGGYTSVGGPTRLERLFVLHGPERTVPMVYAAGGELRWGLRVVAGYEDGLWLFCVPPDHSWGLNDDQAWADGNTKTEPTAIEGVQFAKVEGVLDLAIDSSNGGLTLWVFAVGGMAYTFELDDGRVGKRVRKRVVGRDGAVLDVEDDDGDVIMRDAPTFGETTYYDGTSSLLLPYAADSPEHVVHAPTNAQERHEDEGYWSGEDDEYRPGNGTFSIHVSPVNDRWSEEEVDWELDVDYLGVGTGTVMTQLSSGDILEVSRLEFEVL